jgi:hypothetical protein
MSRHSCRSERRPIGHDDGVERQWLTILRPSTHMFTYKKMIGGVPAFAELELTVEPLPRGEGLRVHVAATLKVEIRSAVLRGLTAGLEEGPFTDLSIRVSRLVVDPSSTTPLAFEHAAFGALREALVRGGAVSID